MNGFVRFSDEGNGDTDEIQPPAAWVRRYGNCRVPSSTDLRAWARGDMQHGLGPTRRQLKHEIECRKNGVHPRTGNFAAQWKPAPNPDRKAAARAHRKSRFRKGDPKLKVIGHRGGRLRSRRKAQAARQNGRSGGYVRSERKAQAARLNGLLGGRPRADGSRLPGWRGGAVTQPKAFQPLPRVGE